MNKILYFFILTIGCGALAAGCGNADKPAAVAPAVQKPAVMQPFRYHKLIEVSPGQDFDILSWGRGASTVGSFAILHSDSAATKYTTTTGDLDGTIVDVFNTDLDLDGNPEILIQTKGKDSLGAANIYAFEFVNSRADRLEFPKLNQSQRQGYRGDDNFYMKDDKFIREFPIYSGTGKSAKKTGQKRQLEYGIRDNSFTVKQLSKGSTTVSTPVTRSPAPASPVVKQRKQNTTSSKHHNTTPKKTKKKRKKHHRSDDEG
jgi:hypothetical protein